jgi:hypothetical protein
MARARRRKHNDTPFKKDDVGPDGCILKGIHVGKGRTVAWEVWGPPKHPCEDYLGMFLYDRTREKWGLTFNAFVEATDDSKGQELFQFDTFGEILSAAKKRRTEIEGR